MFEYIVVCVCLSVRQVSVGSVDFRTSFPCGSPNTNKTLYNIPNLPLLSDCRNSFSALKDQRIRTLLFELTFYS